MREAMKTRRSWHFGFLAIAGALLFLVGTQACGNARPDAADGNGSLLGLQTGACNTEGAKASCHYETGRVGDVVNCFAGTQICANGVWGPCGSNDENGATVSSKSLSNLAANGGEASGPSGSSTGLHWLAVSNSDAATDAPSCLANPCNPYCKGIEVDADRMTLDGGGTFAIMGTVATPDTFPAGLDGPKNAMGTFATTGTNANAACTQGFPPANGKVCSSDYCCAQYNVGGNPYTCQPWVNETGMNPVAEAKCVKPTGAVDYTLGLACNDTNGQVHVPLCNRGTVDATSGTIMVAEYPGNPKYAGDLSGPAPGAFCNNPGNPSAYCLVNLAAKNVKAGKCIDVNVSAGTAAGTAAGVTCSSGFSSGNRTMMVNPPAPPGKSFATAFAPAYTTLNEGDQCNNYSFHPTTAQGGTCSAYGEVLPPPATQSFQYEALCNPGFRVQWNQLSYSTIVPTESQVVFSVSVAQYAGDGGVGTFSAPVTAATVKSTSSPDPAICSMSGAPDANACPKNLATILGEVASHYDVLKVSVTETAISAIPTVLGWQVTYNCVPYE